MKMSLESDTIIVLSRLSAKRLGEELDGWLRAAALPKSPEVRGVIAP